ncbi:hypothetical protein D9Q98_009228 [Chlorella vulgaris]|uniref:Uncharacterized protein n=1 Tax=Chlorella vulgaris TaxID=3077 RepID=A0A9D4TP83_CHLVU|nr:hypothetical protein D9Q98_009228 [Chlorella vulgaris]
MVQTRSARAPEVPSSFGLIRALLAGNTSRARQLLHQALVSGPSGFSCLHAAALSDCHRLIAPLVAARLQANEANAEAPIPAAMAGPDQQIGPLDGAAASALRTFLREHSKLPSAKICAVFRGVTPLHIAAWLGHQATLQALLQAGADTELPCLEGRTALSIACYFLDCRPKRSLCIIEMLLAAGADPLCADFHGVGSLVLSPHCPRPIQTFLLDHVLARFGGPPPTSQPEPPFLSLPAADAAQGPLQPLDLAPDKHSDVLLAALVARHKRAFDFFLAATVPEVSYPSHACNRILSLAIMEGDVPLVQRILTCGLRPRADGYNGQGHPLIAIAAVHGHADVMDVLCVHGASVTLKALHYAADTRSCQALQLLLARGRPAVLTSDAAIRVGGAHSRSGELCVVLRLLRDTAFRLRYCYRNDVHRHALESLAMVELLADAGYRPTVYPQAIVHNGWVDLLGRLVHNYDPTVDKPTAFDLDGVNRYTWLAAKCEPWTAVNHHRWPPSFQAAVRSLLLMHHAGRAAHGGAGSAAPRLVHTKSYALPVGVGAPPESLTVLTRAAKRARLEELPQLRAPVAMAAPAGTGRKAAAAGTAPAAAAPRKQRGLASGSQPAAAAAAPRVPAVRAALCCLPPEILLDIIRRAAYPVSAWLSPESLPSDVGHLGVSTFWG